MIGIFIIWSPKFGVEKMKMPHGVGKKKKKEEKEGEERGLWRGGLSTYMLISNILFLALSGFFFSLAKMH